MSKPALPPHPATVLQRRALPPHAATIMQARAPHPATGAPRSAVGPHVATTPGVRPGTCAARAVAPGALAASPGVAQRMNMDVVDPHAAMRHETLQLALKAMEHMRSLVIHNDKDSEKGKLRKEDRIADEVYASEYQQSHHPERLVSAYARVGTKHYFATNTVVPQGAQQALSQKYTDGAIEFIDDDGGLKGLHAEMKVFERAGGREYIGVNKLCCLYCAAQLLALDFRGFRGCHMASYNNYVWLRYATDDDGDWFRARLWGHDVASAVAKLSEDAWEQFKSWVSNGATLLQKYREAYQEQHVNTVRIYSEQNQIPYGLRTTDEH